jgi:hypothetical protein
MMGQCLRMEFGLVSGANIITTNKTWKTEKSLEYSKYEYILLF